ncbi:MAG: hypothetical protein QF473_04605 [Planctomycetota bacterium]|nr:hypothetical protein [Planctomycetota bacterium]MDP6505129.1 hypothetical protein [Planctomycetota bacterium]
MPEPREMETECPDSLEGDLRARGSASGAKAPRLPGMKVWESVCGVARMPLSRHPYTRAEGFPGRRLPALSSPLASESSQHPDAVRIAHRGPPRQCHEGR